VTRINAPVFLSVLIAAISLHGGSCAAQKYPAQTINVVAATTPGGGVDLMARVVAQKLTDMGARAIVMNKPGGSSIIGFEFAAKAAPDGYTLLLASGGFATNQFMYDKLPYDSVRDFAPVIFVGYIPLILVAHPSFPPNTVRELIALAKAKPGEIQFANGSSGSGGALSGQLLKQLAHIDIAFIPYKGNSPALNAVVGGHVSAIIDTLTTSLPFVQAGRLKVLAVTSAKRSSLVPQYPTMMEAGLPTFDVTAWYILFAPKKTPREIVLKLNADLNKAFTEPDLIKRMSAQGIDLTGGTPEQAEAHVQAEINRWGPVIKSAGIKGE
jgi:tripartite-type tricarboxylate transporter receptor subunit TctC